jgi:hypothetical protein
MEFDDNGMAILLPKEQDLLELPSPVSVRRINLQSVQAGIDARRRSLHARQEAKPSELTAAERAEILPDALRLLADMDLLQTMTVQLLTYQEHHIGPSES